MSRNSEMSMRDVRNLYLRCGEPARNLATALLGDPFQGEKVARKAFLDLLGCDADRFEPGPMLDAWMHEEVVRLCLMRSGNVEVADWEEYQLTHDDEEPKSRRAKDAQGPGADSSATGDRAERVAVSGRVFPQDGAVDPFSRRVLSSKPIVRTEGHETWPAKVAGRVSLSLSA